MDKCSFCDLDFDIGDPNIPKIKCEICKNYEIHLCCADMNMDDYNTMCNIKNLCWICDTCKINFNMLEKLNQINTKLEVLSRIDTKFSTIDENINDIKEMCDQKLKVNSNSSKFTTTSASNECDEMGCRTTPDMSKSYSEICNNSTPKHTQSNIVDSNFKQSKLSKPILIIKSSDASKGPDMRRRVKKLLSPLQDPVKSIGVTTQGKLVVHCNDQQSVFKIKRKIMSTIDDITVNEPTAVTPKIRVVAVDAIEIENINNTEIVSKIRQQNSDLINKNSRIEIVSKRKRYDQNYDIVFKCDYVDFNKIIAGKKIKIGWSICAAHEDLNVIRCYKCNSYGHTAINCKDPDQYCPLCAGKHEVNFCPKTEEKCINCVRLNKRMNTKEPENHTVWSHICPVYIRQLDLRRERTNYE